MVSVQLLSLIYLFCLPGTENKALKVSDEPVHKEAGLELYLNPHSLLPRSSTSKTHSSSRKHHFNLYTTSYLVQQELTVALPV